MQVEVDFDNTQVAEHEWKRWKRDGVAKDMLLSCAEDAANKATKEMASPMMNDAEEWEPVQIRESTAFVFLFLIWRF